MIKIDYLKRLEDELYALNYSRKTIKTYTTGFKIFSKFIKKPIHHANKKDLKDFKIYMVKKKTEPKTINTYLAAVKFFYRKAMNRNFQISGVKQKKKMPLVHDRDFILDMINKTKNLKHKLLIILIYSSGLRVSEAVKVKIEDLDIKNKMCLIRQGKGKKDRLTILSKTFIHYLKKYLKERTTGYLFPGRKGHLSIRTAQEIVKQSAGKVVKNKPVFCHSLRSSFATHLLENNVDIKLIKELLGHSNIQTTQSYIKVCKKELRKVQSPLDQS